MDNLSKIVVVITAQTYAISQTTRNLDVTVCCGCSGVRQDSYYITAQGEELQLRSELSISDLCDIRA